MGNSNSTTQLNSELEGVTKSYGAGSDLSVFQSVGEWFTDYESLSAKVNTWQIPSKPLWGWSENENIKDFYERKVEIKGRQWQKHCEYIDSILEYFFNELRSHAEKNYPYIQLQRFVRQGSSREGLKAGDANEFDAVLPFRFVLFDTEVIESPGNGLPPGLAEIKVTKVRRGPTHPLLIKERYDGSYINTEVFHDSIFKGLVDKTLSKFQQESNEMQAAGYSVCFSIKRRSHAPAMILDIRIHERDSSGMTVNTEFMSIDLVPGFLVGTSESKKFLVSRWIPESLNLNLRHQYPDRETIWRISLSHFEMEIIEGVKNNQSCLHLMTACRILKAVQSCDRDGYPSQFSSVVKSYHIKNILLYAMLYTFVKQKNISSVTEAFGCLVTLMRTAFAKENLPQFCTDKYALKTFFPLEQQPLSKENLFSEKVSSSLVQANLDLGRVLSRHGLHVSGDYGDCKQFFIDRIHGVQPEEEWRCTVQ